MADETPISGSGGGEHILGMGLDIGPYITALQEALEAYNAFSNKFSKSLAIRIDPQSLNALSNAFGIQMRQAVGLIKGAQKETVQQSAEMVKDVNAQFKKISGFEAFKEISRRAKKAKEEVKKEAGEIAESLSDLGKKVGQNVGAAVKKGTDAAKEQLHELNQATSDQAKAQGLLQQGRIAEAERYTRMLAKSIADYGHKVGTPDAADRIREKSGVDINAIPTKTVDTKRGQKIVVDQERVLSMLRQIQVAYEDVSTAEGQYLDRSSSMYERAISRVDKLRAAYQALPQAAKDLYAQLRRQKEIAESLEPDAAQALAGRTPYGQYGTAEDLTRRVSVDNDEGTRSEKTILAERKFQAEIAMMRDAAAQAAAIRKDANEAEEKLLKQGEQTTKERVKATVAQYRHLRDEKKRIDKEIQKDADEAEEKLLAQAKRTNDEKIAAAKAYYRNLKAEEKAEAQANRSLAGYQKDVALDASGADKLASGLQGTLNRISKTTGTKFREVSASEFLDANGLIDDEAAARASALSKRAEVELATYRDELTERNRVIRENTAAEERIEREVKAALAKAPHLKEAIDAQAQALRSQYIRPVPAAPTAGPAIAQMAVDYRPDRQAAVEINQGRLTTTPPAPVPHAQKVDLTGIKQLQDGYKSADADAQKLLKTNGGIAFSLGQQAINMAKWLFFYKAVHEFTALIQRGIHNVVAAGIEYTRELENQQLALRGILAENYNVTDQQGKQLTGLAALTALQITSKNQWREIQQASLSVVGTTADLMGLYAGILPFASNLGASLTQVQDLTKSTAVAASLLDISFQDARSAIISLLQGRALVRNRLVGALGFTKDELANLAGTPALFEKVMSRLSAFLDLSDDASNTFAALSESFKDFTGIIASGFTAPMVNLFKEFVKALTDTNSSFALFEKSASGIGLTIKPQLQAFIDFAAAAFGMLARDIKDAAKDFALGNVDNLQQWVVGIRSIVSAVASGIAVFAKGAAILAEFVAENRLMIKALGWGVLLLGLGGIVVKYVAFIRNATLGTTLFGRALNSVTGSLGAFITGQDKASQAAARTGKAASGSVGAIRTLGASFAVAGAAYAIEQIISKILQAKQVAESTKEAMEALGEGDTAAAVVGFQDALRSGSGGQKVGASFRLLEQGNNLIGQIEKFFRGDIKNIPRIGAEFTDTIAKLDVEIEQAGRQLGGLRAAFQSASRESLGLRGRSREEIELQNRIKDVDEQLKGIPLAAARRQTLDEIASNNDALGKLTAQLATGANVVEDTTDKQQELRDRIGSLSTSLTVYDKAIGVLSGAKEGTLRKDAGKYNDIIEREALANQIDPDLIRAVIKQESAFNPKAVSSVGAQGLMQLMPGTAKDLGVTNPFDPEQNIRAGAKYLGDLLKKAGGDISKALAGYNAGPARAAKGGTLPTETENYIKAITATFRAAVASRPRENVFTDGAANLVEPIDFRLEELRALEAERAEALKSKAALEEELSNLQRNLTDEEIAQKQMDLSSLQQKSTALEARLSEINKRIGNELSAQTLQEVENLEKQRTALTDELAKAHAKASAANTAQDVDAATKESESLKKQILELTDKRDDLLHKKAEVQAKADEFPQLRQALSLITAQRRIVDKALDQVSAEIGTGLTLSSVAFNATASNPNVTAESVAAKAVEILKNLGLGEGEKTGNKELDAQNLFGLTQGLTKLFTPAVETLRSERQEVTIPAILAFVKGEFTKLEEKNKQLLIEEGVYSLARETQLTPTPIERNADGKPDFAATAPTLTSAEQARVRVRKSLIEREVAEEQKTRVKADDELKQIDIDFATFREKAIKDDIKRYKDYLAEMDKLDPDKAPSPEDRNKQFLQFESAESDAAADRDVLTNERVTEAAERKKRFDKEIEESNLRLAKSVGDMFGIVEDSALATWDKSVLQIKTDLTNISDGSDEEVAAIKRIMDAFTAKRPTQALQSQAKDDIQNAEKTLSSARDQYGLLIDALRVGDVSASHYFDTVRSIRDTEAQALEKLIAALELKKRLASERLVNEKDERSATALKADIQQFANEAAAARAELERLNSVAARVQLALQAWSDLTSQVMTFMSAADGLSGTNTALEDMVHWLTTGVSMLDKIVASATAFSKIGAAFNTFKGMFSDAGGGKGLAGSFGALGGLVKGGIGSIGNLFGIGNTKPLGTLNVASAVQAPVDMATGAVSDTASVSTMSKAGASFAAAIPAIGIGISAALAIGTAIFNHGVEKAKKDINKSWENLTKSINSGAVTLGKGIAEAEKERQRIVAKYSDSKSGRKALKELLPNIDDQIDALKDRAKDIQKSFEEAFKQLVDFGGNTMKPGPFTDFAHDLMNLEKFVREYLDSINTATQQGLKDYANALGNVQTYVDAFFENAKAQFGEEMLGFESEALSAQERLFSLINARDGLYRQLGDLAQDRLDLEESIQDEQERRRDSQNKLNDLAKKELEIRKQIAEVIRQAAEDEAAIRRRGVLEAQLSVAQQKAIEISQVRYKAQEEVDRLKEELAGLQGDIKDEAKDNARKDRDFQRRRDSIDQREDDIRKELRLNDIRISGARAVANIEGEVFGLASNEYDLAERQNQLAIQQAQIQVQKWRETKALFDAIIAGASGFFFEPPAGFPQIKVELGSIIIDNRDQSSNSFQGTGSPGPGGGTRPGPRRRPDGEGPTRDDGRFETDAYASGTLARRQGYGDLA